MKNRFWLLLIFILILPTALYYFYQPNAQLLMQRLREAAHKANKGPTLQPLPHKAQKTKPEKTLESKPKLDPKPAPKSEPAIPSTPEVTPNIPSNNPEQKVTESKTSTLKYSIQNWETSNGTKVFFVAAPSIPMIDIILSFDAGSARDGAKPGLASLLMRLLDKGTPHLSANQIAEKLEDAGVQFQSNVTRDSANIAIRSLTQQPALDSTADLFADLLFNSNYPDAPFSQEKQLILVELKQKEQQPNVTAAKAFFAALYPNHPYGNPVFGTEKGIADITKNDLEQFHQNYIVAKNATLSIVGDLTLEQAKALSNKITQKLPAGKTADSIPKVEMLAAPTTLNIAFPSEQTHVMLGQPCASQRDPDEFSLMVANYILGGDAFSSRLYKEVREDRGLAYSVISAIIEYQQAGPFLIQLQTKNIQSAEAIQVVNQTLDRYLKEGPTDKEVEDAKQGIISAFPLNISNNAKISGYVSYIGFYKLPLNYLDTFQQKVQAVTAAEVKSAIARRLDPTKMALITVGKVTP